MVAVAVAADAEKSVECRTNKCLKPMFLLLLVVVVVPVRP
jgi:hypothetical protein